MGFPIPGNAIEQSLDLNQRLLKHTASTFVMQVDAAMDTHADVRPGDLLIVDRALTAQPKALVVAVIESELTVMRYQPQPPSELEATSEIWGVVTSLIREFP
ncbi:MAG: S24 family peptidase [Cyanobacteria bacterium J06555_13]